MSADLAVIIISYRSGPDVIRCLQSLITCRDNGLRIVVADNASPDGSAAMIRDWITLHDAPVELIETGCNLGYAYGVNRALEHLVPDVHLKWFWVLNPDMTVPRGSLVALRNSLTTTGPFSLLGGRVLYDDGSERLQTDGGTVNLWTGVTHNVNLGKTLSEQPPKPSDLDFIMGGNMVASREFLEATCLMREDYFLYYEEVDWALRRPADLPLAICPAFIVHHAAGTSIGSATLDRGASPFAQYWKHRARLRFVARFNPIGLPVALAWTAAKAIQLTLKHQGKGAAAMLKGAAAAIRTRVSP